MCMHQYIAGNGLLDAMRHPTHSVPDRVRLFSAMPHVHLHAIHIELIDAVTDETLCLMTRDNGGIRYGTGREAGNEEGYIVGLGMCTWSVEGVPEYRNDHPFRLIAAYNASEPRTGVMAQWIFSVF